MADSADEFIFKIDCPPARNINKFHEGLDQRLKVNAYLKKIKGDGSSSPKSSKKEGKHHSRAGASNGSPVSKTSGVSAIIDRIKRQAKPKAISYQVSAFFREKCPNCEKKFANPNCTNQSCVDCCVASELPCKYKHHTSKKTSSSSELAPAGKRKEMDSESESEPVSPKKVKTPVKVLTSPKKSPKAVKAADIARKAMATLRKAAIRKEKNTESLKLSDEEALKKYSVAAIKKFPITNAYLGGKLIEHLFEGLFDGFKIPKEEIYATDGGCMKELLGFGSATYGEISFRSIPHLVDLFDVQPNDVFYDLGSGVGKCVLQFAAHANCKAVIGIESSKSRNDAADMAKERFIEFYRGVEGKDPTTEIRFVNENILEYDFSDATIVLWNNVCFPVDTCKNVVEKLVKLKTGTKVITMRKLCSDRHGLSCVLKQLPCVNFHLKRTESVYCTWTTDCSAFVYERI